MRVVVAMVDITHVRNALSEWRASDNVRVCLCAHGGVPPRTHMAARLPPRPGAMHMNTNDQCCAQMHAMPATVV